MKKCDGPECPECGCEETVVVSTKHKTARRKDPIGDSWIDFKCSVTTLECQHCGKTFPIGSPWVEIGSHKKLRF